MEKFAFACNHSPGASDDKSFRALLEKILGRDPSLLKKLACNVCTMNPVQQQRQTLGQGRNRPVKIFKRSSRSYISAGGTTKTLDRHQDSWPL